MVTHQTPGVYKEDVFPTPAAGLQTGVPAILGFATQGQVNTPEPLTLWSQFSQRFGAPLANGYLGSAVRGFFENGGELCFVVRLDDAADPLTAHQDGLAKVAALQAIDLVCAPDIVRPRQPGDLPPLLDEARAMQGAVLDHCDALGDRFGILDSMPQLTIAQVLQQRALLSGINGALYYPWIRVADGPVVTRSFVPPCGHVAGVYARSDARIGVHKAPANETLEGVLDLEVILSNAEQERLNPEGVNALRAFPGRGLRVWGARTLSRDATWRYVNVRRLFLTVARWIERNMPDVTFEPNNLSLWVRISRELTSYFNDLFRRGALLGRTADEAFYVKCDADTNSPQVRDAGMVVTEIGLAAGVPNEFIVVRIIHGATGITISGT